MQLLSSIADLKDIVNKEYIDSILANYVLSANLGALATKDSLAFSDLTSRPSKLSDFTDDVVAGKYLPLSGGTVTGTIEFTASTPALKFYRDYGNVPYIHFGASPTSGYGEVGADKNGNLVFWSLVSGNSAYNAWNTVLHAKNIGEYALPLSGGTLTGTLTLSKEGSDIFVIDRLNSSSPTTITYRKDNSLLGRMGFDASTKEPVAQVSGTYHTLLHSGNYSNYALPLSGGTINGSLTLNEGVLYFISSGKQYAYNVNTSNGEPIFLKNDAWHTLLHSGNYSSYALPITGGTISGNGANLLAVNRQDGNPVIEFRNNGSLIGRYGFTTDGTPIGVVMGSQVTLIHSGNIGSQIVEGITTHTGDARNAGGDITKLNAYYSSGAFRLSRFNGLNGLGTRNADGLIVNWPLDYAYGQQWYMDDESHTIQTRYVSGGTWSGWKTIAFTDSNVASATKLATARTIWGQSFDGTGNVSGTLKNVSWIELTGTNFGIYQGSALNSALTDNDIALYSQKVYMSGNVGIGTTDPKYTLDVDGNISTSGEVFLNHNKAIRMKGSNGTDYNVLFTSGTDLNIGYDSPVIRFGGSKMFINSSGNVTIGSSDTASSEYKLDVVGKARVSDELIVTNPTGIRWAYGNYGTLFRNDGQNFYILFTDSGGALTGSWNSLRPFRISLTTGDVAMEHNLTVGGQVKAGAEACANKRFVIFAPSEQAKGVSFGYMKATIANAYNVGIAHLGCNYGGASDITNTSVDYTAISMYRSVVGIGKEYDYASIRAIYDAKADLGVTKGVMIGSATLLWDSASSSLKMSNLLTAKGGINVTATDSANNSGQSGVAGVFLRNEGGIEISHASTPYIDFHYAKSTSDFDVRLICQSTNDLRISGHFYPMFSLNYELGAQSLRWSAIWAGGMNLSGNADISGVATVGSLKIGNIVLTDENGTLKIAGNAYTTGQLATGKAGQAASGGGSVQYWSNEYDMDIGTDVLVSSKEYIGTNTIVGWDLAGSCLNDLYIGYDGYTIWMQGSVDEASDMRLKTVIDAVNLDIRDIAYAPIFNYVFKSRPQGRQMLGSSAQYWQAIAPKAVSENDKGNLAMNYGAIALASVVAVAKKVVTHEEEIAELKSKVQSLETRLAKYELN